MIDDVINSTLTVTVKGYEDDNGAATNWRVNAYAICANPLAGLERVVAPGVPSTRPTARP